MVPTCYGRQAILDEFGGFMALRMPTSIDSNRVVDVKRCCLTAVFYISVFYSVLDACIS